MLRLFTTSASALARAEGCSDEQAARELLARGLIEGMPFVITDQGEPVRALNRWLRSLPSNGAASPKTWVAYALDLIDWYEFLERQGRGLLQAGRDDLAGYHAERRLGDGGGDRLLAPSSWNRKMAALDSFYSWAVEERLIGATPFSYRYSRTSLSGGGSASIRTNLAKERTGRVHAAIKWLSAEQLATFLDVGMTGLLPDGSEDPRFLGRNAGRNRAFAELLASTGMRAQEGSHLLLVEIPDVPRSAQLVRIELPGPICKGAKPRTVLAPPKALRQISSYALMERAVAASRGRYRPPRPLGFSNLTPTSVSLDRKTSLSKLSLEQRQRLVDQGSSPLAFLTSTGAPIRQWQQVFDAASARCQTFDRSFPSVTPHTLRHTFAVNMLQFLIEQVAAGIKRQSDPDRAMLAAGYWRVYDPLLTLRDLLGHASVTTTQVYLSAIDATRWYANFIEERKDDDGEPD